MLTFRSSFYFKKICQLNQLNIINRNLSKSVKLVDDIKSTKTAKPTKTTKNCKGCKSCKCNTNSVFQVDDFVSKEKQIDHHSLTWILTLMDKDCLKLTNDQIADYHGHSGGSWSWTNYQIKVIKEKGFNYWFYKTDGPLGYGHEFKKIF